MSNRLFYLSIPPNIFVDVVRCASSRASSSSGWTRVIVEKPFGRDFESSGELTRCLKQYLTEEQIFRYVITYFEIYSLLFGIFSIILHFHLNMEIILFNVQD